MISAIRALKTLRSRLSVRQAIAASVALAALLVAAWLPADFASASSPAGPPAAQAQASSCPPPSGLRLPADWTVLVELPQVQDELVPYAIIQSSDPDAASGALFRLPPSPDAATALKARIDSFVSAVGGPTQMRPVTTPLTPNADSTAAALVQATDDRGQFIAYFIVATSGTLTCSLEVEAVGPYVRANNDALAALMQSFFLVP